jgi:DNA-binding SARP family transcriptional activator
MEQPSIDIRIYAAFCMSLYYYWTGEYHKNALLLERADAEIPHRILSPLAVIRIKMMKGNHYWVTGQYDAALQSLSEGLDISGRSGVHVFDPMLWNFLAAVEMTSGKLELAEKSLRNQMISALSTGRALDIFFSHLNSAWHAILTGNTSLAAEKLETIAVTVEKLGIPYYEALLNICMAQVAFLQGHPGDARAHVNKAHRIGLSMKSEVIEWYSLLIAAWLLLQEGEEKKGVLSLRRGFALGKRHGYIHQTFYQPSVMRFLCAKALAQGIEEDYCRFLIKKLGLTPPVSGMPCGHALMTDLSRWPYPIRICTLGRFAIFKDNGELQDGGKTQKKPLEMLKALIAAGGADVSAARLAEELWPDAEGDHARKSFEVTLSRLRHLFDKEIILYSGGQLTINQDCCRVDSLVLAGIIEQAVKAPPERIGGLCDQALGLYQGHFLPDDTALAWSVHRREKLKNGLLQIILKAGRHAEHTGGWEEAAGYYEAGLNIDPLTEEFYQHLMICYRELGRQAAAVKAYRRFAELLLKRMGIKPSHETRAIYSSLLEQT